MKKILFLLLIGFVILSAKVSAQGVAVNNTGQAADSSAIMDVSSTQQGVVLPRMTEAQRNAIQNPANGLIIFNLTSGCYNYYSYGQWFEWCGSCIPPQTPVIISNAPVCEGDSLKLFTTFVNNVTYSWSGPGGFSSTLQNPVIPISSLSNSGTYTLVLNQNGCVSSPGTLSVTVNALPQASFNYSPVPPVINQNVTFSPAVSGASYSWTFQSGNPATSNQQNPVVQWSATGTYLVGLSVTQNGCSASSSQSLNLVNCGSVHGSQTFNYTGNSQSFTVPACVYSLQLEAWGAQGGNAASGGYTGGRGGYAYGTISVNPGDVIYVYVGGKGQDASSPSNNYTAGGFNGGGTGVSEGGGGGGGSDIRVGGTALSNRVLVAGGGGGAYCNSWADNGGYGGGLSGQSRQVTTGGTQSAGGDYGGQLGQGGSQSNTGYMCGGGGGGYYGGGAPQVNGTGSGGSSYYGGTQPPNGTTADVRTGHGQVTITW